MNNLHKENRTAITTEKTKIGMWSNAATITLNNFKFKSLSNWALNTAMGCLHGCPFCYVPSSSTNKQKPKLAEYGVQDPDAEWGEYLLLRQWDERAFLRSLREAQDTPRRELKPDGNRAVLYCSTTDPYQVIHHPAAQEQKKLNQHARLLVRRSLELIRDQSDLNVRILTRSPLARLDFELFKSFGKRLMFGMSLPTLRHDLTKVYEPAAPAPTQRLATLQAAREAGLNIFVAMAPTFPECHEDDLRATLRAIAEVEPLTIFHEPVNVRSGNIVRINEQARILGVRVNTEVFSSPEQWQDYAIGSLKTVERLATELGLRDRLHLWPDKALGTASALRRVPNPQEHLQWLQRCWARISEWPST